MNIHSLTKLLYGAIGLFFLLIGLAVLSSTIGLLPAFIEAMVLTAAQHNATSYQILLEFGALLIFAGLISLWYVKEYPHSMAFHKLMIVYWFLMSAIHWAD